MSGKTVLNRSLQAALVAAVAIHAGSAAAVEFQIGENSLKVENLFTIGASWRMQDRDPSLISKSNLWRLQHPTGPGLCYTRTNDDGVNGPAGPDTSDTGQGGNITMIAGSIPNGCGTSQTGQGSNEAASNAAYRAAPGSYDPSGDNGNLNFDKGEIVHAIAKLTSDISFSYAEYNFFVRPIYYFDASYTDFTTNYPNTTLQDREQELPNKAVDRVGSDLQVLDYHVSHVFNLGERGINVKVGNQVLNWGESSLLVFNSLNSINPLDATKVRMPGVDLKEFFQPLGMALISTDLFENVSVETWYGYEHKPLLIDPPGTFFSQSDLLGPGGTYAQNGQGREPDDPNGWFRGIDTCNPQCVGTPGNLGSTSSRIVRRNFAEEAKRAPSDTGQYGAKLQLFLENFNNGTELAFYYANYHSRFPLVSAIAATERSCLDLDAHPGGCGVLAPGQNADNPATPAYDEEPLPVDTISVFIEYPEDIQMFGTSFNTTIGDWAWSGEIAYRPEQPTQIHSIDISLAALGPAFPRNDVSVVEPVTGQNLVLGQRAAFPDFVSVYRGIEGGYDNGDYIRGYEYLKTANISTTFLRLIGGDNPIGASQMTILLEMGMNQVFDMPGLDELQFQGGGANTPASTGADNIPGINPRDIRSDPNDPSTSRYDNTPGARQNVTAHQDRLGWGTSESYGYRVLNLNRWDSALFGANLETLTIIQHDVKGTSPGIGTNFLQGRKQYAFGIRADYLSTYIGEVRYSWNTGGAGRDGLRDRDNIQVYFGVQF